MNTPRASTNSQFRKRWSTQEFLQRHAERVAARKEYWKGYHTTGPKRKYAK